MREQLLIHRDYWSHNLMPTIEKSQKLCHMDPWSLLFRGRSQSCAVLWVVLDLLGGRPDFFIELIITIWMAKYGRCCEEQRHDKCGEIWLYMELCSWTLKEANGSSWGLSTNSWLHIKSYRGTLSLYGQHRVKDTHSEDAFESYIPLFVKVVILPDRFSFGHALPRFKTMYGAYTSKS